MGMHDTPQMADTFGVPTFYATHVIRENAGYGNVRVLNCTMRGGILIPNSEVIFPATQIVTVCRDIASFAQDLFLAEQMMMAGGRH